MLEILFFADMDIISKLIRWRLSCPYSHTAIRINNSIIYESHWPDVRMVTDQEAIDYGKTAVAHVVIDCTNDQINQGMRWANTKLGEKYDLVDMLAIGLGFIAALPKHWICSSFVAAFLDESGILPCEDIHAVTPVTLASEFQVEPL